MQRTVGIDAFKKMPDVDVVGGDRAGLARAVVVGAVYLANRFGLERIVDAAVLRRLLDFLDRALGALLEAELAAVGVAHVDDADCHQREDGSDHREFNDGRSALIAEDFAPNAQHGAHPPHATSLTRRELPPLKSKSGQSLSVCIAELPLNSARLTTICRQAAAVLLPPL